MSSSPVMPTPIPPPPIPPPPVGLFIQVKDDLNEDEEEEVGPTFIKVRHGYEVKVSTGGEAVLFSWPKHSQNVKFYVYKVDPEVLIGTSELCYVSFYETLLRESTYSTFLPVEEVKDGYIGDGLYECGGHLYTVDQKDDDKFVYGDGIELMYSDDENSSNEHASNSSSGSPSSNNSKEEKEKEKEEKEKEKEKQDRPYLIWGPRQN